MAVCPSQFAPRTRDDAARIMRAGARDMKQAAKYLGIPKSELWKLVATGLLWSFKRGKRRLVPVVELRRYGTIMAVVAEGIDLQTAE